VGVGAGLRCGVRRMAAPEQQPDDRQPQGVGRVRRPYGNRMVQPQPNGPLQLGLGGIAVAGEDLLGLAHRNLDAAEPALRRRQHDDSGHLAQADSRFGIVLQRENVFDHDQVGRFGRKQAVKSGVNVTESFRQGDGR
jgi:hypothetical protein